VKSLNKSPITRSKIANSSPLAFVLIRANCIFGARDRIVGQSFIVYAAAVRVRRLWIGRAIAFDRAFVFVLIGMWLSWVCTHRSLLMSSLVVAHSSFVVSLRRDD